MSPPRGWAVVTGASRGIGAEIAVRLAGAGNAVVVVATSEAACDPVVGRIRTLGGTVETRVCDLRDRDAVIALGDSIRLAHPAIAVLVNNAGIARPGRIEHLALSDWDDVVGLNLIAPYVLSRSLLPALLRAIPDVVGGPSIVNVGSIMGTLASPGYVPYVVAKAGLHRLTQALAVELGPRGIRVNAVAPGFIRTALFDAAHPPARRAALAASHPLGRVGTPAEVAAVVAFLCSPDASFVSGAVIPIDGGLSGSLAVPPLLDEEEAGDD